MSRQRKPSIGHLLTKNQAYSAVSRSSSKCRKEYSRVAIFKDACINGVNNFISRLKGKDITRRDVRIAIEFSQLECTLSGLSTLEVICKKGVSAAADDL